MEAFKNHGENGHSQADVNSIMLYNSAAGDGQLSDGASIGHSITPSQAEKMSEMMTTEYGSTMSGTALVDVQQRGQGGASSYQALM